MRDLLAEALRDWNRIPSPYAMLTRSQRLAIADVLAPVVSRLIADAEERGRQSVGLGDFLPDPCGEEERAPDWHFVESYGDWLSCSRSSGHDGDHEHSDSGFTWPALAPPVTEPTGEKP
ncbi:hypothetical protein SAMN06272737_10362 [Blastococcus mobilis]|uniref:Uncharacterized protein n=1 Tax=Blastococcus mobilis TaxID=1938746 RepID=A0A238VFK8_9ACTN|nr:hypothetical protein SAMN06272737_10362 [Blastococcus mobilis]